MMSSEEDRFLDSNDEEAASEDGEEEGQDELREGLLWSNFMFSCFNTNQALFHF